MSECWWCCDVDDVDDDELGNVRSMEASRDSPAENQTSLRRVNSILALVGHTNDPRLWQVRDGIADTARCFYVPISGRKGDFRRFRRNAITWKREYTTRGISVRVHSLARQLVPCETLPASRKISRGRLANKNNDGTRL